MYEQHYGLTRPPFAETLGPNGHVWVPSRESAYHRLRYGLEYGQGPVLLVGPPGSGKTRLSMEVEQGLGWPSARLVLPFLPLDDMLVETARALQGSHALELGLEPRRNAMALFRETVARHIESGRQVLLIVDEAHLIHDPTVFEWLKTIQNFHTEGVPDLSLMLVGEPEVLLKIPIGLFDRLTARVTLGPLDRTEALPYLMGRLAEAGCTRTLFSHENAIMMHEAADGLPRRLNRLADLALLIGYAENLEAPNARCVELAIRELAPGSVAA